MSRATISQASLRTRERYRLALWAVAANVASKALAMVLVVMSVKLTIPYLGADRFGVWMMLTSLTAMLAFLDLGIGNALTNRIARAAAQDQPRALQRVITGGLLALAAIGAVAAAMLSLVAAALPWGWLIHIDDAALVAETTVAALVFAVFLGINLFTSGVQKAFLGLQRSYESHLCAAAATTLTIVGLAIAARQQAGVPALLAIVAAGQTFAALPLLALLYWRGQLGGTGAWAAMREEVPVLLRTGSMFLALQIGTMVGWGADSVIISASLGSAQVATYAVVQRLFQLASTPLAIVNQPLWGAYADAHARGDHAFTAHTLRRSLAVTATVAGAIALGLALFHAPIVAAWTSGRILVPPAFLAAFAVWTVIEATATCAAMYMNGCAIIRPQVVAVALFCALSIPTKLLLTGSHGLAGLTLSTVVSYLIAVPLLYAVLFRSEVTAPLRANRHANKPL